MEDAEEGGSMSRMPEPRELDPVAAGLIRASLTSDKFAAERILTRAFEADLDGLRVYDGEPGGSGPGLCVRQ